MEEEQKNSEMLNEIEVESNPSREFLFFIWDLFKTGVIVFLIAFSIRYFLIQPFVVEGGSMLPNFIDKEYLLAEKLSYTLGEPKRGDVVIFKYPNNPSVNFIKRIIGLPGETVVIGDNQVKIINTSHPGGVIIDETSYISSNVKTYTFSDGDFSRTLGNNEYFVMGDNREHSSDSREWGILPESNIIGRAWLTVKPLDKLGIQKRITFTNLSKINDYLPIALLPSK